MTRRPALGREADPRSQNQRRRPSWPAKATFLLVVGAVVLAVEFDLSPTLAAMQEQAWTSRSAAWTFLLIYVVLIAVPFVPGAEIGLALMVVFGAVMAWPVYIATVLALSIAFAVGRLASQHRHPQSYRGAGPTSDALARFAQRLRARRWLQPLLRFRWLAVVVLINMPGNTVIGGGGGVAMAIGYSRAFTYPAFLACAAIAVAPVPALVLIAEHLQLGVRLDRWMHGLTGVSPMSTAHD